VVHSFAIPAPIELTDDGRVQLAAWRGGGLCLRRLDAARRPARREPRPAGFPRARSAASARRSMSTSRRSGLTRWRVATPICFSTRKSRRSATAAAWSRPWPVGLRGARRSPRADRGNREVGRRNDVVGIFPHDRALIRLAGMLCIEQNDDWLVGRAYLSVESISLVLAGPDDHPDTADHDASRRADAA